MKKQKILEIRFIEAVKKYLDIFFKPQLEKKNIIIDAICKRDNI